MVDLTQFRKTLSCISSPDNEVRNAAEVRVKLDLIFLNIKEYCNSVPTWPILVSDFVIFWVTCKL